MPRTLDPLFPGTASPLMVRIIEEDEEHTGTNWWRCQPQGGDVDNPEDDNNRAPLSAWWSCSSTQPKLEAIMWATLIPGSSQWVLSARCCDDTEAAD